MSFNFGSTSVNDVFGFIDVFWFFICIIKTSEADRKVTQPDTAELWALNHNKTEVIPTVRSMFAKRLQPLACNLLKQGPWQCYEWWARVDDCFDHGVLARWDVIWVCFYFPSWSNDIIHQIWENARTTFEIVWFFFVCIYVINFGPVLNFKQI